MSAPKSKPPVNSDYFRAERDKEGDIRLSGGKGILVVLKSHTRYQVQEWFETSRPGQFREQYRAALALFDRESRARG